MLHQVLTLICLALIVHSQPVDKSGITKWASVIENGQIPTDALRGGRDRHGDQYIAIGYFKGDWIPGKYVPTLNNGSFYVAHNKLEHKIEKENFMVMTLKKRNEYMASWTDVEAGNKIETGAYIVANTSDGDTLYVGRRHMFNGYHIGKVSLRQMKCFIPYDGVELSFDDFEVLSISRKVYISTPWKDKKIEMNVIKNT